jgi:transposase
MKGSYLGIDAHATTGLEVAAVDAASGELQWRDRCGLQSQRLIDVVGRAARPCTTVFEQGELATWLHLVLKGTCEHLLVADPTHNRAIARSPHKDDAFDAVTLARLARGGYIKEVYQPPTAFARLRLLVRHELQVGTRIVRLKNQIKALFRQHALVACGNKVYSSERAQWIARLPRFARPLVEDHFRELDVATENLELTRRRLAAAVSESAPSQLLMSIPQVGPVTAATFVAYVVTPERFPSRKKLWTYCGFGLMQRRSGASSEPARLRKDRNHHLKRVLKMAVIRICQQPEHPLGGAYRAKRAAGMADHKAKLTIGRRLINIMATVWNRQQEFDATKVAIV